MLNGILQQEKYLVPLKYEDSLSNKTNAINNIEISKVNYNGKNDYTLDELLNNTDTKSSIKTR
ncbi:hypothetical protein [Mycoplasmopsis verecunda]|uniref:hypothetical protein n=1 Tax=Mycoplasmopsis verecunda TaxID=171291 RepID=UPI000999AB42|nr:hypothetical protein [Mycoplasmopsis verecunda]WPB54272.1 hypothetical protein SAM46_02170 [Mycoplasmopsis verecunda]